MTDRVNQPREESVPTEVVGLGRLRIFQVETARDGVINDTFVQSAVLEAKQKMQQAETISKLKSQAESYKRAADKTAEAEEGKVIDDGKVVHMDDYRPAPETTTTNNIPTEADPAAIIQDAQEKLATIYQLQSPADEIQQRLQNTGTEG